MVTVFLFSCPEHLSLNQSLSESLALTYKDRPKRLVTFETSDESDEETWPGQKRLVPTYLHTYPPTYLSTSI